jgi:hypothetical protein
MRDNREIFCIKIIDSKAFLVPYTLSRIIAFSILFKEPIGYLLWMVFFNFFLIFFYYFYM